MKFVVFAHVLQSGFVSQVEKIVDTRTRAGKQEFLIKWKGYPSIENTWEPRESLFLCVADHYLVFPSRLILR